MFRINRHHTPGNEANFAFVHLLGLYNSPLVRYCPLSFTDEGTEVVEVKQLALIPQMQVRLVPEPVREAVCDHRKLTTQYPAVI